MSQELATEFLIVLGLILVNGVLAGAEIAIVAMRASRVRELAEQGSRSGRALLALRHDPERFLSTIQVGITVVSATAAAFGGAAFAEEFDPLVRRVPGMAEHANEVSLGLVIAVVSYLSIVLGELVPKSLGLRASEGYALLVSRPILTLSWIGRPVVWLLTTSSNTVLRLFGDRTTFTESRLSLEELRGLVDEASRRGSVPEDAGEIASRALELGTLKASDVMVHRRFVIALPRDATPEEMRGVLLDGGHQRTPVYDGSIDHVVGYVAWRDLLARVWTGPPPPLEELLKPGYFVSESTSALELLGEMRARRQHLAVVVDEHGGMAGIVTLEDLLEELVGEIVSERDTLPVRAITPQPDGTAVVLATTPIRDVNRELEVDLDESDKWSTIGGLCLHLAGGRIPRSGERFQARDGSQLEVLEASERRVRVVRIRAKAVSPGV